MQEHQNNGIVKRHLLFLGIGLSAVLFFWLSGIGCPLRRILGFPCPTCGTTRALLSLLQLDLASYFLYQPLALFLLIAIWICIHRNLPQFPLLKSKLLTALLVIFFICWIALYFVRLFLGIIP